MPRILFSTCDRYLRRKIAFQCARHVISIFIGLAISHKSACPHQENGTCTTCKTFAHTYCSACAIVCNFSIFIRQNVRCNTALWYGFCSAAGIGWQSYYMCAVCVYTLCAHTHTIEANTAATQTCSSTSCTSTIPFFPPPPPFRISVWKPDGISFFKLLIRDIDSGVYLARSKGDDALVRKNCCRRPKTEEQDGDVCLLKRRARLGRKWGGNRKYECFIHRSVCVVCVCVCVW